MVTIRDIKTICTAPEGINLLVVKVETSEPGLYGLGCGTFAYRHLAVKMVVEEYLRPLLVGRDVSDINDIWQLMHQNGYWRNGPIENNAISGVDMACGTSKAKWPTCPCTSCSAASAARACRCTAMWMVGISLRSVRTSKNTVRSASRPSAASAAVTAAASTAIPRPVHRWRKARRVSGRQCYIRDTVKLFDGIRSKMGDEIGLVHDVHERIAPADAVRLAKELEPYHLTFLEDPVSLEQVEYIRQIKDASSIPIAEGELFNNPYEYRTLITERLIDYIRVHITQVGGITPARKLQIFAEQFGVRTAWHGPGDMSPLAHAANVHIDLAAPNFGVQEWSGIEPPNFVIQKLKGPMVLCWRCSPVCPSTRTATFTQTTSPALAWT